MIGQAHTTGMRAWLGRARDKAFWPCVAIGFPSILGGLGSGRGFLCRDRDFWPCVVTEILCRDRIWGWDRVFGSRQSFPKAGSFLLRYKILCRDRVCWGGVAAESFMSQPTDQVWACERQAWARA